MLELESPKPSKHRMVIVQAYVKHLDYGTVLQYYKEEQQKRIEKLDSPTDFDQCNFFETNSDCILRIRLIIYIFVFGNSVF